MVGRGLCRTPALLGCGICRRANVCCWRSIGEGDGARRFDESKDPEVEREMGRIYRSRGDVLHSARWQTFRNIGIWIVNCGENGGEVLVKQRCGVVDTSRKYMCPYFCAWTTPASNELYEVVAP